MALVDKDQPSSAESALSEYAKSLSNSASALNDAASSFKDTARSLTGVFSQFNKEYRKNIDKQKKDFHSFSVDMSKYFEEFGNEQEKTLSKYQKMHLNLIDGLKKVVKFATESLNRGLESTFNAFNQNLYDITVRMRMSMREYSNMNIQTTNRLFADNLIRQFSQNDFQKALTEVLSAGLRNTGLNVSSVQDIAYQNMISEKLLPAINTNTRAFIRYNKTLGTQFGEAITAIGLYTQQVYGAEGQQNFNAVLESMQKEMQMMAITQGESLGWTSQQIRDQMTNNNENLLAFYSKMANDYGLSDAEGWLSVIKGVFQGNPASNKFMAAVGIPDANSLYRLLTSPQGYDEFINRIQGNFLNSTTTDANALNVVAQELGIDADLLRGVRISQYTGLSESLASAMEKYDRNSVYTEGLNDLQSGMYASIATQFDKFNENLTSYLTNKVAMYLPNLNSLETLVRIGYAALGLLGAKLTGSSFTRGGANGEGTGGSLFGGLKSDWGKFAGGQSRSSKLGKAGLVAGIALSATDAISGATSAIAAGQNAVYGALRGALSGETSFVTSADFQKALQGEGDYGFNGMNTLKNAGKYAGFGAYFGGPVGAAIGGVVGAFANIFAQLDPQKLALDKLQKSSKALNTAFDNLTTSSEQYEQVINNQSSLSDIFKVIRENEWGSDATNSAVNELANMFPDQAGWIKMLDKSGLSNVEVLLSKMLTVQQQQLEIEMANSVAEITKNMPQQWSAIQSYLGNTLIDTSTFNKLSAAEQANYTKYNDAFYINNTDQDKYSNALSALTTYEMNVAKLGIAKELGFIKNNPALLNSLLSAESLANARLSNDQGTVNSILSGFVNSGIEGLDWSLENILENAVPHANGSRYIPNDQFAKLHRGEMVLTKAQADAVRGYLIEGTAGTNANNYSPVETINAIRTASSAITEVLERIYTAVSAVSASSSATRPVGSTFTVNENLRNYSGA